MNRAYSRLDIKSISNEPTEVVIRGVASTPTVDRMGDVVEPLGAKFKTPMPLLWQHMSWAPVGLVTFAKPSKSGVPFEARLPIIKEAGLLKDRIDEAIQSIKHRLVAAVSIGFAPREGKTETMKNGGLRFLEWDWLELSLVTIPANAEATITTIKSIDTAQRAAIGKAQGSVSPPAIGRTSSNPPNVKESKMKAYTSESLAALRETRSGHAARMQELFESGLSAESRPEFDELKASVASLDDEIAVSEVHVGNIAKAKPVEQVRTSGYSGHIINKKVNDVEPSFKGEEGVKKFVAQTIATIDGRKGIFRSPAEVAEQLWGKTNPTLVRVMKANQVAGGGSDSGEALSELVSVDNRFTGDFVDMLYGATVFDSLPLTSVPANVSIKGLDGAYTGYFIGQSKAIKMSQGSASAVSTVPYKVAGLTVLSNELIRDSSPAALGLVASALREALSQIVDSTFLSATAISAGVSPAGILNGLGAISSNGSDAQSVITDLKALFAPFVSAKNTAGSYCFIMTPTTAIALSLMKNALGQPEYPTINGNGGTLLGYPVYVGDNVGTGDVILMHPNQIWKIGDGGVQLSVSTDATIEQSSAPVGATDTPVAMTEYMTSMFQEESTAIKVVRSISWAKKYASSVAYIGNAAWGAEQS